MACPKPFPCTGRGCPRVLRTPARPSLLRSAVSGILTRSLAGLLHLCISQVTKSLSLLLGGTISLLGMNARGRPFPVCALSVPPRNTRALSSTSATKTELVTQDGHLEHQGWSKKGCFLVQLWQPALDGLGLALVKILS